MAKDEKETTVTGVEVVRHADGRFVKGMPSLNPGGRPKGVGEVRRLAQAHAPEAIATLVSAMRTAKDIKVRCAAAVAILDRGYGRPVATVQRTDWDMIKDHLSELGYKTTAQEVARLGV